MSCIYTFPSQITPSGTVDISIKTSLGSGSVSVVNKFFSQITITEETDYYGGDIVLPSASLSIENDTDNYFDNNIFPSLVYDAVSNSFPFAIITISLDTRVLFIGCLKAETIQKNYWSLKNDSMSDGGENSFSMQAVNIFDTLKNIPLNDVVAYIGANPASFGILYLPGYFSGYLGFIQLNLLFNSILVYLNTINGITTTITTAKAFDYQFLTRDDLQQSISPYDIMNANGNKTDFAMGTIFNLFMFFSFSYDDGATISKYLGIFNDADEVFVDGSSSGLSPFKTVYELFIGIIKAFGFFPKLKYVDSSNVNILLTDRLSGTTRAIDQVLTLSDVPFSPIKRDSVSLSSSTSENKYDKQNNNIKQNTFSFDTKLDIGLPVTDKYRFMRPLLGNGNINMKAVQSIVRGNTLIADGDLSNVTEYNNWTKVEFSPVFSFVAGKGMKAIINIYDGNRFIHTLNENFYGKYKLLVMFDYELNFVASGSIASHVNIYIDYYDSNGNKIKTDTAVIYDTNTRIVAGGRQSLVLVTGITFDSKSSAYLKDIRFGFFQNALTGSYIYVRNVKVFKYSDSLPEHVGRIAVDSFSQQGTNVKNIKANGIQDRIELCDNQLIRDETYYFKKREFNLTDNETNFELINYKV